MDFAENFVGVCLCGVGIGGGLLTWNLGVVFGVIVICDLLCASLIICGCLVGFGLLWFGAWVLALVWFT